MSHPQARITGPHDIDGDTIYLAQIWDGCGSLLLDEEHHNPQEAHDAIRAVLPAVTVHWCVGSAGSGLL